MRYSLSQLLPSMYFDQLALSRRMVYLLAVLVLSFFSVATALAASPHRSVTAQGGNSNNPNALTAQLPDSLSVLEGAIIDLSTTSVIGGKAPYTYNWNFGDGTTATDAVPTHRYDDDGTYLLTLTVTDARNKTAVATANVTTSNVAPTPVITLSEPKTTGTAITFSATATDPSLQDTAAGFTYVWDLGIKTATGTDVAATYYTPGSYTVTLTVIDKDGGVGVATSTFTVTGEARIIPGDGWTGPTATPAPVGDSSDFGYTDVTTARFDTVPYQTFTDDLRVGVVAFHNSGIDRVAFATEGGPWTEVTEPSLNPDTGVVEYWATLSAADFPDGNIEVRAIAYPTTGIPRVLDGLYLSTNASDSLPTTVIYVAPNGDDATGTGSPSSPYASISRAISAIQVAQGDVGGGTVYLLPGEYAYGNAPENWTRYAADRWLTITTAPGYDASEVIINTQGSSAGVRTQKVHLKNLTIRDITLASVNSINPALWLDNITYIGPGTNVFNSQVMAGPTIWKGGIYYTDVELSNSQNGAIWGNVVRHADVHHISSDAFQNSMLVIDSTASHINASGTTYHPDVWQAVGPRENIILYGVTATDSIGAQGVFADPNSPLTDVAFIDVTLNNQNPDPTVLYAFQFGSAVKNLYVADSSFTGPSHWRTDLGFTAEDVVVDNTYFSAALNEVPGVYVR